MRLALVMVEKDPRRPVELADDNPLRAVDNESPVVGHQRHLAEIDFLFLHIADASCVRFRVPIPDHQLNGHLHGSGKSHPSLAALVHIVFGITYLVLDEFKRRRLIEILDGKDALEYGLQPDLMALLVGDHGLEEVLIGLFLDIDKIGYIDDLFDFRKVLPQSSAGPFRIVHDSLLRGPNSLF